MVPGRHDSVESVRLTSGPAEWFCQLKSSLAPAGSSLAISMQGRVLPEQVHNTYSTTLQDSMCIVACWLLRGLAYLYLAGGKPPASTPPLLGVIFAHASSPKRAVTRLPRLLWRRRVWLFSRLRSSRATPLAIPPLCRSGRLAVNLLLASRLVAVVGARVAVCVTGQLRAGACNTTPRPLPPPLEFKFFRFGPV